MARCAPQTLSVSLEVTLVTFPPFSAPKGETHGRHLASASGPGTSVLKADLVVMSSLPLSGATASPPLCRCSLACQTGAPHFFLHLDNGIWPCRHCLKIDHANYKRKSHMKYALEQTLKTWSSLSFKVGSHQVSLS